MAPSSRRRSPILRDPIRHWYDAVERYDASIASTLSLACDLASKNELHKGCLGRFAARSMKLRRIEVSDPNFDPFIRIGRLAHTQAVAIADISNRTRKLDARTIRQGAFARIGFCGCRYDEEGEWGNAEHRSPVHAASFMALRRPFFARRVRTNAFHFFIAARFSGM